LNLNMRKVNHRIFEKDICENKEKGESLKMSEKTKIKKLEIKRHLVNISVRTGSYMR
jgi:hypothetical protein